MEKARNIHEMLNLFNSILGEQPAKTYVSDTRNNIIIQMVYAEDVFVPKEELLIPSWDTHTVPEDKEHGILSAYCRIRTVKDDTYGMSFHLCLDWDCFNPTPFHCDSRPFADRISAAGNKFNEIAEVWNLPHVELGKAFTLQAQKDVIKRLRDKAELMTGLTGRLSLDNIAETKNDLEGYFLGISLIEDTAKYLLYHAPRPWQEKGDINNGKDLQHP